MTSPDLIPSYPPLQMAASGSNPAIDLNSLRSTTADYVVASVANPAFAYHFNPCGATVLQDSKCLRNTSVCEVHVADNAGRDVYAIDTSIQLSWSGSDVVMNMRGTSSCPYDPSKSYTSTITFKCIEGENAFTLKVFAPPFPPFPFSFSSKHLALSFPQFPASNSVPMLDVHPVYRRRNRFFLVTLISNLPPSWLVEYRSQRIRVMTAISGPRRVSTLLKADPFQLR